EAGGGVTGASASTPPPSPSPLPRGQGGTALPVAPAEQRRDVIDRRMVGAEPRRDDLPELPAVFAQIGEAGGPAVAGDRRRVGRRRMEAAGAVDIHLRLDVPA